MAALLRVYAPVGEEVPQQDAPESSVAVRLEELLPLVALAHRRNYAWLHDFLDDEVLISPDLFEVLHAFRCTRPSA